MIWSLGIAGGVAKRRRVFIANRLLHPHSLFSVDARIAATKPKSSLDQHHVRLVYCGIPSIYAAILGF